MANIIDAIATLVESNNFNLPRATNGNNRANNQGDALEIYVKNLFADTIDCSEIERMEKWSKVFSWSGNKSNPPDFMLKEGDAVEVKKIESQDSALALNSSYPKHTLKSSSSLISSACREAEDWTEKDIIYTIGVVNGNKLKHLCMVYGRDYCASDECYERFCELSPVADSLHDEIIPVDPTGNTFVQICACMKNPWQAFHYVYQLNFQAEFCFMCIINSEKWAQLENRDELCKLSKSCPALKIADVRIKNPDNPANLKDAKLIDFSMGFE